MTWLTNIFSSSASSLVDSVGNAVDKLVTSDQEKLQLKNELVKIKLEASQRAEEQALQLDKEITQRWKSDNEHALTRLVRPAAYAWMMFLFTIIVLLDGNLTMFGATFSVDKAYVPVIQALMMTMTIAYFGSRGIEKVAGIIKKDK